MRRPLAVHAEVARRVDQAGAEVFLPDAVDDHPQRDRLRGDGARQLEPAAAFREGRRARRLQHREEAARHGVAQAHRVAAQVHLQVDRLLDVANAVHVGVLRRQRLLHRLDVLAQAFDQRAAIAAEPLLEPPAGEAQQPRPRRLAGRVIGIEIAHEHVAPERGALRRHAAQLEAAARAEVVVGLELVGQVRRLLRLGRRQRPRLDDVVLFLDLALFEDHADQQLLEGVGQRRRLPSPCRRARSSPASP